LDNCKLQLKFFTIMKISLNALILPVISHLDLMTMDGVFKPATNSQCLWVTIQLFHASHGEALTRQLLLRIAKTLMA
jgi:hypothetical protein